MDNGVVKHLDLYRLPWNLSDNAISWLEPTAMCNLKCDGCYRENEKDSHKSLDDVKHELDVFQKLRKSDCISIAGGDPLMYPDIVPLVREIKSRGLKPIINTNGKALTKELLKELKDAGVFGFTFHMDSKQGRGGEWKGKNELELNELRLKFAKMLHEEGNIACSFNSTVYEDTLHYVPGIVKWAQDNIEIVHSMVFIAFRHVVPALPFDWYAFDQKVEWQDIMYHSDAKRNIEILSTDVLKKTKEEFPEFEPSAFLNGTEKPDSYKWMLTERIGNKKKIFGYPGAKFIELIMSAYHFKTDRYLSYASPKTARMGKSALLFLWPFDSRLRRALVSYLKYLLINPFRIFQRVYLQTILFIQPVDFMKDGGQSMCDGCPDITVYKDKLVYSCRMEENKQFGTLLRSVPKN